MPETLNNLGVLTMRKCFWIIAPVLGLVASVAASDASTEARLAIDGRDDTAWVGSADATQWTWTARFVSPAHVALVRARVGALKSALLRILAK